MGSGHDVQARSRDDAVALLWHQYYSRLVRLAIGLTGDACAAEEVVQDAFAGLLGRWGSVRDPSASYTYLLRSVSNGARARWRRHRRRQDRPSVTVAQAVVEHDVEGRLDVLAAMTRLPYGKRACLLLRYYADLSQAQVADVLGVSVGTVKSQTAKGLHELAELLDENHVRTR